RHGTAGHSSHLARHPAPLRPPDPPGVRRPHPPARRREMNPILVAVPRPAPAPMSRPMPSVWWPWACQLLAADTTTGSVELDLLALEPCRLRGAIVAAGTGFSLWAAAPPPRLPGGLAPTAARSPTPTTGTRPGRP